MQQSQKIMRVTLTFLLIFIYLKYCLQQYTEFFYEAQFLHIGFLKDAVSGVYSAKNFFTVYGEHLFPGYNILLFLNYKLFSVTSLFELVVSVVVSIGIATILSSIVIKEKQSIWLSVIIFAIVLSPIQNIMMGMALAAHISTFLLVAILYVIYYRKEEHVTLAQLLWISFLVPVYILFFAGAYSFGFLAVLSAIFAFSHVRKEKKLLIVLSVISICSYLIYYVLLKKYSPPPEVKPFQFDILRIFQFIDLMLGSSLLGKAYFERVNSFTLYYFVGAFLSSLLLASAILYRVKKNLQKSDKIFIILSLYAIANVVVVAITRNSNGLDGALGQWYEAHLKFIPIAIAYFLFRFESLNGLYEGLHKLLIILFMLFLSIGYWCDYKKAPAAKAWKNEKKATIPEHLIHPQVYLSSTEPDPLLWNKQMVHDGLVFLYKNKLSYFKYDQKLMTSLETS